ncbi:MAG: hypothetical protein CBARDCOR_6719 [uncultured Caballeronia sp.]|nr:MAG: hypothetical protein CBARDCOR_6719 [uncultured Caballeronia sp.]
MAYSHVLNLISNATSLVMFIVMGKMVWGAGIAMSLGEVAGVYAGSYLVHKTEPAWCGRSWLSRALRWLQNP